MNALFSKADIFLFVSSALRRQGPNASQHISLVSACIWLDTTVRPEALTHRLTFLCAVIRGGTASGMHSNHGPFLTKEARTAWGLISSQILPMF